MQEHDEIDGLFKNGLENFKPDASHLSYAPLASAIAAKTTVSGTAAAAKTGFFAKWGMTLYFGLSTVAAGTGVAIVYAPDHVAVETNSKTILVASIQVKEELQLLGELPVIDSVSINEEGFSVAEEVPVSAVEPAKTKEHEPIVSNEKRTFNTVVSGPQKETMTPEKRVKHGILSANEIESTVASETTSKQDWATESSNRKALAIQPNVIAKSIAELPLKNKQTVQEKIQSSPIPVDTTISMAEVIRSEALSKIALTENDSVENLVSRVMQRPPAVWPESRISIKAGLGYAPLGTAIIIHQEEYVDSLFFFDFYQNVVDRPTIKNEFLASVSYQKRIKSNLQLGVGLSYMQGGWKSFTDHTHYYYVDNGLGELYLVTDTVKVGERDITANSISLNLFTGYDFVLGQKWMIGTTIGLNLNQMFIQNDFRNYSSNAITSDKKASFVVGVYGSADVNYRVSSRLGLSIGASINGRANVAKAMGAGEFYNSASFGLNAGFHYFISGLR
ncbi:MAG: hypothetical protein V4604_07240 [Bacteroidota bacterium]